MVKKIKKEMEKRYGQMEKMILKIHKSEPIGGDIVRINKEAAELVKQMQIETGLPASKIVSECIRFASQHYEVLEV